MTPRYSLYGEPGIWNGNVQEDVEGRWLKWKDAESYVQYALAHGYIPPTPMESTPKLQKGKIGEVITDDLEPTMMSELPLGGDQQSDLYDIMMSHNGLAAEDEV